MRRYRWVVLALVVVALVAVGGLIVVQGRSAAAQYAGIGSFFLALLTVAWSVVSWARGRPRPGSVRPDDVTPSSPDDGLPDEAPTVAPHDPSATGQPSVVVIGDGTGVQTGKRSRMTIANTYRSRKR